MKQGIYKVIENKALTATTYRMRLSGDISGISAPGQFINIQLDGHFLRRPISICDAHLESSDAGTAQGVITIIYKVLGQGTEEMTRYPIGRELDVLVGLGNGYDLSEAGEAPLLIGGGVGIPPLYLTAKALLKAGIKPTVILGFNSEDEVYYTDEFTSLGCEVITATADGSVGIKGFVTDAFRASEGTYTHFYTCGPLPMLKAVYEEVYENSGIPGQMSFEERMGCGVGACMGCSIKVKNGYKRVCKDGPVFRTEEIVW